MSDSSGMPPLEGSRIHFLVPPDLTGRITKFDNQYCAAGGFGDVYRCQYHSEWGVKEVAVKTFRFEFTIEEEDRNEISNRMIRRELGIWKRLSHPNIVPFLGTVSGFGRLGNASLVSSWMPNGTLQDFLLKHDDKLTVAHRLQFLLGIANGLHHLHSLSIIHGDLTCNNVLLDEEHNARLTDFGYASLVGEIPEALAYLQASTLRPGAVRWAAPEYFFSNPEEMVYCTTKSDIYSFGNIALQVLSGELPWSEFRRDVVVVLHLAKGHKPRRPQSHPIDDQHWEFIEHCWSPVQERPSAERLVLSVLDFLRSFPHSQPLCGLLVSSEKSNPQSTLSRPLLSPPNIEQFSRDVPLEVTRTFENLHLMAPNSQHNLLPSIGALSPPRTTHNPPQLILDSNLSTLQLLPRKPFTHIVPEEDDGDKTAPQAGHFQSALETHNQNGSAVNPDVSVTDIILPKLPPPAHSKSGPADPRFFNTSSIGQDPLNIYPFLYPSSQQHSIDHQHSQGATFGRGDRGAATGSRDGRGGIWSFFFGRFDPYTPSMSTVANRRFHAGSPQPDNGARIRLLTMASNHTTGASHRRGKQDAKFLGHDRLTHSEDMTPSIVYPPSSQQEFIDRQFLHPQDTVPSIRDHSRRASSGSRGGGDGALSSPRASPYPSPSASPRVRYEDLPNVPLTGRPFSMLRPDSPQPNNGAVITVSKQTVTSERTAGASRRRRKQDVNFLCPVPGCGSTFTRSFNLKGHMKSHNEERPFQCGWPSCGKGFARQRDRRHHEQLHLNHRSFSCEGCNETFTCMGALNRHRGAECQRILDASKNLEGLLVAKIEEKGWPSMSGLISDHVGPSLLPRVTFIAGIISPGAHQDNLTTVSTTPFYC